jgi:hypothetical protein
MVISKETPNNHGLVHLFMLEPDTPNQPKDPGEGSEDSYCKGNQKATIAQRELLNAKYPNFRLSVQSGSTFIFA